MGERRKVPALVLRSAIFNRQVLPLNVADFRETPPNGIHAVGVRFGRSPGKGIYRHRRLLRLEAPTRRPRLRLTWNSRRFIGPPLWVCQRSLCRHHALAENQRPFRQAWRQTYIEPAIRIRFVWMARQQIWSADGPRMRRRGLESAATQPLFQAAWFLAPLP